MKKNSTVLEKIILSVVVCCVFGSMFYVIFVSGSVIISLLVGFSVLFILYSAEIND